nr:hypothetical protein [Vibrio maerlii]
MDEFSFSDSASKIILKRCQTALIFIAISILVNAAIRLDYVLLGNNLGEISITETLEQFSLLVSAFAFFLLSKHRSDTKHAATLIASFFLVMFIRELDFLFDMIAHGSWVYPALAITFAALAYAAKDIRGTINQLAEILRSPYMNILIIGLMLLLVYSRLFGMGNFWKGVMSEHYVRDVKNIAEEGTELLAYLIISFGSIRTYLSLTRSK